MKIGDKLWFVPDEPLARQIEVEVVWIGRTWLGLSNGYRANKSDLTFEQLVAGAQSPGTLYSSKQAYDHQTTTRAGEWSALRKLVAGTRSAPEGLTAAQIATIYQAVLDAAYPPAPF